MTRTYNDLPLWRMSIDESDDSETGVEFISLVDYPAIEVDWVAMSESKKKYQFNKDKQTITGPVMIPNLPIYRADEIRGEYYVDFSIEDIEVIQRKFSKQQKTLAINYKHQDNSQVKDAIIIENWFITDKENDKSNSLGFDLPVGTWMSTTYIADKTFWEKEIKSGNVRGYSIEGFLNLEMSKMKNKMNMNKNLTEVKTSQGFSLFIDGDVLLELLKKESTETVDNKIKETEMEKIKMETEIKTVDGVVLYTPGDSFVEGVEVWTIDGDGNQVLATDGDYVLENGSTITIVEGKITTVATEQLQEETQPEAEQPQTEQKLALTPEDLQSIMDQIEPRFKEMADKIAELEGKIGMASQEVNEVKETMSKTPGAESLTIKSDRGMFTGKTKMSFEDKIERLKNLKK